MIQNINLYNNLQKPSPYVINAKRARLILFGWIFLLLAISTLQGVYVFTTTQRLSYLERQEKKLAAQFDALLEKPQNTKKIYTLNKKKQVLIKTLTEKSIEFKDLYHYNSPKSQFKPSDYLLALAKTITPNVWLTHIALLNNGKTISLEGVTLGTSQLTQFRAALESDPLFKNQTFSKSIEDTDESTEELTFALSTQAEEQSKKP